MMWVDLKNPLLLNNIHPMLGTFGFKALRFNQSDYLNTQSNSRNIFALLIPSK